MSRDHGAMKYKKEGCRCGLCRAGHAERIGGQRARRRASAAPVTSDAPATRVRRSASAPSAVGPSSPHVGRVRAASVRVAPSVAPRATVASAGSDPGERVALDYAPAGRTLQSDPEPASEWTPEIWDDFREAIRLLAERECVTIRLNPGLDYGELAELAEAWDTDNRGFGLQWQHDSEPERMMLWTENLSRTPGKSREKIRYTIIPSMRGMCEVRTEHDESSCNHSASVYTVNSRPSCQDHYNSIRADYPERCQYQMMGEWKNAP